MSVTFRTQNSLGDTAGTGNRSVTTATNALAAGDLLVVFYCLSTNTQASPTCSDDNPDGLGQYDLVATALWSASANIVGCFVRRQLITNTATTTVTVSAGTNDAGVVGVIQCQGAKTAGAGAVRQSATGANGASGVAPTASFGSAALTGNMTLFAAGSGDTTTTPPASWTERFDTSTTIPTTALEVATRDSGFTGTAVTAGATQSAVWGCIIVEIITSLGPAALTDNNGANWSDTKSAGYGNQIPDVMELLDADSTNQLAGKQNIEYNGWAHWMEDYRMRVTNSVTGITAQFLPISDGNERTKILSVSGNPSVTLTETLVWQDGTPLERLQLGLGIICPHLGANWLDAVIDVLGLLKTASDTLTMSDSLSAGYGNSTSDQIVIVDSLGSGYGAVLSDNDNFWSDFAAVGFGLTNSDQLIISDSIGAGYGAQLSDNDNFWSDSYSQQLITSTVQLTLTLSDDDGANWLDFVAAGYGNSTSDQLVIVDSLGAGYGGSLSDQMTLTDFQSLGYGAGVSDTLNNWLDSEQNVLGMTETLSDTMTFSDSLAAGYGNSISDQMSLSDSLLAGYGAATSDQIVFVDSLGAGYSAGLSDAMSMSDFQALGYGFVLTDNLNNWADSVIDVLGLLKNFADTMTMADSLAAGYGNSTSDQIIIVDSLGAGYGALLSDNDNFWQDAFSLFINQPLIQLTLSDDEGPNWSDQLRAGYGNATSDQIVIVDSLGTGYGAVLSDNDNFWADSETSSLSIAEILSDNLNNWLDSVRAGYGNSTSDQLTMSDNLGAGYGSATSDQIIIVDSIGAGYGLLAFDFDSFWLDAYSSTFGMLVVLADNLNFWLDVLVTRADTALVIADSLSFTDVLGTGYGMQPSDQMLPADSLIGGVGLIVSDDGSVNWEDFFTTTGLFPFVYDLSDSLDFWDDSFSDFITTNTSPARYQLVRIDQRATPNYVIAVNQVTYRLARVFKDPLVLTNYGSDTSDNNSGQWFDQVGVSVSAASDLGLVLGDDLSGLWQDSALPDSELPGLVLLSLNDNLTQSDNVGVGHGWQISDSQVLSDSVLAVDPNTSLIQMAADTLAFTDTYTSMLNWRAVVADSSTWSDAVTVNLISSQLTLLLGDSLAWSDSVAKQFGMRMAVSDTANNYSDAASHSVIASTLTLQFAESLNNWQDFVPAFVQEYGAAIGENNSANWKDAVTKTLS